MAEGKAEYITLVDGAMDVLRKDAKPEESAVVKDAVEAQTVATGSQAESAQLAKRAKALKDSGDPDANSKQTIDDLVTATDKQAAGPKAAK